MQLSDFFSIFCNRETYTLIETFPASNTTRTVRKRRKSTLWGRDLPFHNANSEMCRTLKDAEDINTILWQQQAFITSRFWEAILITRAVDSTCHTTAGWLCNLRRSIKSIYKENQVVLVFFIMQYSCCMPTVTENVMFQNPKGENQGVLSTRIHVLSSPIVQITLSTILFKEDWKNTAAFFQLQCHTCPCYVYGIAV